MQLDSSDVTPVPKAVQALGSRQARAREALELGAYVERLGNADAKQNLGILLALSGPPLLEVQPPDPPLIVDVGKRRGSAHESGKS